MPYRMIVDSTGTEWQAWDIVPRLSERRNAQQTDRRVERRVIPFADRRREGRRIAHTRRAVLHGSYAHGWLCFETNTEKRRLSPIPDDWTTCSDEDMEAYIRQAQPVSGAHRYLGNFSSEEPLAEAG